MVEARGYGGFVRFVTDSASHFARHTNARFDSIFMGGDHSAKAVDQEVPMALSVLNRNRIILPHDYFPGGRPLWSNASVIPGPFLATERLRREGARIGVVPLNELPWTTKLQSCVTSLALVLKDE